MTQFVKTSPSWARETAANVGRGICATSRIRMLDGPHRGVTCTLVDHLVIGRGEGCDIQILDEGVSRRHVRIVRDQYQRWILEDLGSGNGTYIDDRPVDRAVLVSGTVFEVRSDGHRFVFEEVHASLGPVADATELPLPIVLGAPANVGHRVADDDIIPAIAAYRSLRVRTDGNEVRTSADEAQLAELELRVSPPPDVGTDVDATCGFGRFPCTVVGTVRTFSGQEHTVHVVEIGVDGAMIETSGISFGVRPLLWLVLEAVGPNGPQTCVFLARETLAIDGCIDLMFSGSARWAFRDLPPSPQDQPAPISIHPEPRGGSPLPFVAGEIGG